MMDVRWLLFMRGLSLAGLVVSGNIAARSHSALSYVLAFGLATLCGALFCFWLLVEPKYPVSKKVESKPVPKLPNEGGVG